MAPKKTHEQIAKAARDGAGIDAAMRRAVAKAVEERRKLGLPIVANDRDSVKLNGHGKK